MAKLAQRVKGRIAAQRVASLLSDRYAAQPHLVAGVVVGPGLAAVNGRLIAASGLGDMTPGTAVTLENAGTPGLAQYVAGGGGSAALVVGGGTGAGGGGTNDHGQLAGLLDDDHPQYLTAARGGLLFVPLARKVATAATSGLAGGGELGADLSLSLAAHAAGAGLRYNNNQLMVGAGTLIGVGDDSVSLSDGTAQYQAPVTGADNKPAYAALADFAGAGLTFGDGKYNVGAANTGAEGLTVEADVVRLTSRSNPGAAASVLATNADGGIFLDTNLLYIDAPNNRVGINRAPGGAALDVLAANNADHTQRLKQKAGQTGRLWRVENAAGDELIVLDSEGNLQSGSPGFVSGFTGWQMSHIGDFEANNARIRGELHASIFVMDEFHSSGGTLFIAPAGRLETNAALDAAAGDPAAVNVRSAAFTETALSVRSAAFAEKAITARSIENYVEITDPPSGHALVFSAGDRLRCKTMALGAGVDVYDIWMQVTSVRDMGAYFRYYVSILNGTTPVTLPAGAAIINYRKVGDGLIVLTADQGYAPYIQVVISGERPWLGEITPTVRMGRLDGVGVPGVSGIYQHGIALGRNLADANEPYFVASDRQLASYKIDSRWNDGGNDTAQIEASGRMRLGTNISQAQTTFFDANPAAGTLQIGSPATAANVALYGTLYLPSGAPVETVRWRGAWGSGTAYAKQDSISYNGRSYIATAAHISSGSNEPTDAGAPWNLLADQGATGATGATGASGSNAKLVTLMAGALVFAVDNSGIADPTAIPLIATGQNVAGSPVWSTSPATALTGSGNSRSLAYTAMVSESVTITVAWDGLTDSVTVVKVRGGANGADGLPALTMAMGNEAHVLPADTAGNVLNYAGSGTTFQVLEGATALAAASGGGAGTFAVALVSAMPVNVRSAAFAERTLSVRSTAFAEKAITVRSLPLTPGAISYAAGVATVGNHSAMSTAIDLVLLVYQVTVTRSNGQVVTLEKAQTISKSRQGATGAQGPQGPQGPQGQQGVNGAAFSFLAQAEANLVGKTAGLYMTEDKVGFWSGLAFGSYIDKIGNFKFGTTGALEYDSNVNQLRGRVGTTTHWYADGSTGWFMAGGGAVALTNAGIGLKAQAYVNWTNTANAIVWAETLPATNIIAKMEALNVPGDASYLYAYSRATTTQDGDSTFGNRTSSNEWGASVRAKTDWTGSAWKKELTLSGDAAFLNGVTVWGDLKKRVSGNDYDVSLSNHTHDYSSTFAAIGHTHDYSSIFAPLSHAHSAYAPLAGATFTGAVNVNGALSTGVNTSNSADSAYYLDIGLWKDSTAGPAAPAANKVRLYLRKTSDGQRLQLYAKFPGAGGGEVAVATAAG